jgi:hypothetical protein
MARRAKPAPSELETLSRDVAERFKDVPWELFDSKDLGASGETRYMVSRIQNDLMKVADKDPVQAGRIWDAHVPGFVARPAELPPSEKEPAPVNSIEPGRSRRRRAPAEAYLDQPVQAKQDTSTPDIVRSRGPSAPENAPSSSQPKAAPPSINDPDAEKAKRLLEGLEKQYLKADDRYHFRDRGREVAFEAKDKKLVTQFDTPAVVTSMIDLAEARGWSSLKLNGTASFKREAWLQASLRGVEVTGYKPGKLDKARLDELRSERGSAAPPNTMAQERDRASPATAMLANPQASEPRVPLTAAEAQFVAVMEATMRKRGDRPETIAKARELASDRLTKDRIHVGKLVEVGSAPYQDRQGERDSPFVMLENDKGGRSKVWGADLPRALQESGAKPGQRIAVALDGRKPVEVDVTVKDGAGQTIRTERQTVDRNNWRVVQIDNLREDARDALLKQAQSRTAAPVLKTFDRTAPSQPRPAPKAPARSRGQERTR